MLDRLTPGDGDRPSSRRSASACAAALAEALDVDDVTRAHAPTRTARAAEREQWNDADNYLTIAPGVVVGYDRNVVTNTMLRRPRHRGHRASPAANSAAAAAAPAA